MGILSSIKKLLNGSLTSEKASKSEMSVQGHSEYENSQYIKQVKRKRYSLVQTLELNIVKADSWASFFSQQKENQKFIGFKHRSRRKFRHLYHNNKIIVTEAEKVIEIVSEEEHFKIAFKDTPIEKYRANQANEQGVLLVQKNAIAMINVNNGSTFIYEFEWQPFSLAMGDNFWLVGTRETYEGPGELYCFGYDGEQKWAITFKETFSTVFGDLTFMPYLLDVSSDSTDIFVSSMDRLYRLDREGVLKARIAISDLKKKDLEEKYQNLNQSISREPKTEKETIHLFAKQMAAQFSLGFEESTVNSPFSSFAHDPKTDMLFLLENKGRISAWDHNGSLQWINSFQQGGTYLEWVDNKAVVSFETGETFWLDRDGFFLYGAKLPMQAASISLVPNKDTYLVVCKDHRLYEMHKESGELVKGSDGHPGMKLFRINGQNIFFDGEEHKQGYFWLAPEGQEWEHFQAKTFLEADNHKIDTGVAPEITPTKEFKKAHVLKSDYDWFGSRVIDMERGRFYVVEKGPETDIKDLVEMSESERRKDRLNHYLVCYDLNGRVVWKKQLYSEMWALYGSPDNTTLFTSVPLKEQVTYEPGYILILSNEGKELKKFKVDAHGFHLDFISNERAIIKFAAEIGKRDIGLLTRNDNNWELIFSEENVEKDLYPFGAGLHHFESEQFTLARTDKKKYSLKSNHNQKDLNLKAAIYGAVETPNRELAFRSGTRLIAFYNQELEKTKEVKESEAIQTFAVGDNSIVVVMKEEIKGYNKEGLLQWRYGSLPKSEEFKIAWYPNSQLYVWVVSNSNEMIVASITEQGVVRRSQSFKKQVFHRELLMYPNQEVFIAQTNSQIQVFNLE